MIVGDGRSTWAVRKKGVPLPMLLPTNDLETGLPRGLRVLFKATSSATFAVLLAVSALSLAGCGGEAEVKVARPPSGTMSPTAVVDTPTPLPDTVIEGQVSLPAQAVAAGFVERFASLVVAKVDALTAPNVEPVGAGVVVRLIRLTVSDIEGGVIGGGTEIATAETDADGRYSFTENDVPNGITPDTCRLMAQVGEGASQTRAFVASNSVDVDFESEATLRLILETIVAGRASLCDFDSFDILDIGAAVEDAPGTIQGMSPAEVNAAATAAARTDPGVQESIAAAVPPVDTPTSRPPTNTPDRRPTNTPPPPPTETERPTRTPTDTMVPTATPATTATATVAPTDTFTPTHTNTFTPTNTNTFTPTNTNTFTPTQSRTPTSPPNTDTPEPTNTDTPEPTNTDTPEPTNTDTPEPTEPPTQTPTGVPTGTAATVTPTAVPTGTAATVTPTGVPTGTAMTMIPTNTPTVPLDTPTVPVDTPTVPADTATPTNTSTNTPEPTDTNTPEPTDTFTQTPTRTDTPTNTNTPTPTDTPAPPSATPTETAIPGLGSNICTLGEGSELLLRLLVSPLPVNPKGSISIDCGAVDPITGESPCTCEVNELDAIPLLGIGDVCVSNYEPILLRML